MGLVLRKTVVAGKAIWRDQNITGTFLSDELYDFVLDNAMTKLEASKVEAV